LIPDPDKPMTQPEPTSSLTEHRAFLLLLVGISIAFLWVLFPFYGAVLWGTILSVLFAPLYYRLVKRFRGRRTWAALATLGVILLIVVLPLMVLTGSLVQETASVVARVQSGDLSFARYFERIVGALPAWVTDLMQRFGFGDLDALEKKLVAGLTQGGQTIAMQVFNFGQNTLDLVVSFFITLYLAFFLIRDGAALNRRIGDAIPLDERHKHRLGAKFFTVIRATVKGNVLVAAAQGALGGLAFAFLDINAALFWSVVMAFLSLLPAVGAGLVWLPVALYLLATGSVWQGVALVAYGVLVIGLVDNVLRPILVGKDTKMPDYLVLISTLGGMSLFGINGFVIGPVIAAMFIAVWDIFAETRAAQATETPGLP
jgi:predicted PurR-regulated permease PerM